MIQHHLLMLVRQIQKAKGFFLINALGLSTGIACAGLIYLWVADERSMNKFNERDEEVWQVMENQQYANEVMTTSSTPGLLAEALTAEVPEVAYAATTTWVEPMTLSVGEKSLKAEGFHVGPQFFQIFSYPLLSGDRAKVLEDKFALVISTDLAMRMFGSTDVVGKTLEIQHKESFHITGVFEKVRNSTWQFDFVMNFEYYKANNEWVLSWGNNGPSTYVRLQPGADIASLNSRLSDFVKKKSKDSNVTLFFAHYSERYLHGRYENGKLAGGRVEYVRLFSIIAGFILFIACINFMNLSTARASRRAREVGIRKSIGAQRTSLIGQYLGESIAIAAVATAVAMGLVYMALPAFNVVTQKHLVMPWNDTTIWWLIPVMILFTGLLAGSYPALFLSGFMPAQVLKGVVHGSWSELWARRGLVVFQFLLSVVLIVSVTVIYQQVEYVQSQNLGYDREHLIHFPIEGKIEKTRESFLTEVRRVPGVVHATSMSHTFLGRNNNTSGLEWEGKNPDEEILFENISVNADALPTMGVEIGSGRWFLPENPADTGKIVFNEAAIRAMGLTDPVGKHIRLWGNHDLEIIGVLKDFHFQSLHDVINPVFFRYQPENTWYITIRLEAGREKETLAALTALYKEFNPGFSFEYQWQDQEYAKMYAAEQRVATLSGSFAALAIVISCLGLFGLAAYTAERRIKEVGIRKALGSSAFNIVLLLSRDFTRLVLLSIALGLPLGYWLLSKWLEQFAFHVDLSIWYFVMAGALSLCIAWVTVASQAIRAARVNPVTSLRQE